MRCPYCQSEELKVTDSRTASDHNAIKRRRECLSCGTRFTTFETIELVLQVHKRDGHYEDFLKQKLIGGLLAACQHTRVSRERVHSVADEIAQELANQQVRVITTAALGEMVMDRLKELDSIAYVRFACVYRRFSEVGELMELIHSMEPVQGATDVLAKQ